MIKINFPNEAAFRQEFLAAAKLPLLGKITNLVIALDQSLGRNIRKGQGFQSFKGMTRTVINTVRKDPLPNNQFNHPDFIQTVTNYRHGALLHDVNLDGLFDLMTELKANNGEGLEKLLLCPANNLSETHANLLDDNDLDKDNSQEMAILKLVFNYEDYDDISSAIRQIYREKNLVHYCPYCNQEKSMYTPGLNGKIADVHQLDHFFDKATFPLLAFSLYNLVPGDATCNATNKKSIPFSKIYHMNPYERGFDDCAVFSAVIDDIEFKVTEIKMLILTNDPDLRKQLIGDGADVNLDGKHGNINVFELTSKYNRVDVLEWATNAVENIRKVANSVNNVMDILNAAGLPDPHTRYANWYRKTLGARFDEASFHLFPYSKMYRDIHDEIYVKRGGAPTPELQDILDQRFI